MTSDQLASQPIPPVDVAPQPAKQERLVSLDAFRGLTMMLMVMVNNAGSGAIYHEFRHSHWNGWTIADTIFPSFVWIVGVAITISLGSRLQRGVPRMRLFQQILRRAAILFLLGLIVYIAPNFSLSTQRILGVLQRIAICYLIASVVYLTTGIRGQLAWLVGLLAVYWMMMTLIPVPGYGAGNLTRDGNFSHYIDSIILGRHNYGSTRTWDPEGIVSTLPAIATALFGIMAGHLLRLKRSASERTVWMFIAGNVLLGVALIANIWMPINKSIWTASFSMFMAGLDFVIFAGFFWLIDGCGWRRWVQPIVIMGMNAIAVYMLSELAAEALDMIPMKSAGSLRDWIYNTFFVPYASASIAALLYAIAFTAVMYLFAYFLYRRKWFLRV